MVFVWKEIRRFGWPLRAIIWFPLAIARSYVIVALLTGYVQKTNLPLCTAMSVRDLLTFNLFLQFTDCLVSYQVFALGAIEANPVVATAIVHWGMVGGLIYNKAFACLLLFLIFALRHNRHLMTIRGLSVTASVYVYAIAFCFWQLLR